MDDNQDIVQDVVPAGRKSVRNIPLPENKKYYNAEMHRPQAPQVSDGMTPPPVSPTPPPPPAEEPSEKPSHHQQRPIHGGIVPPRRRHRRRGKWFFIGTGALLILLIGLGVLSFFDAAELTVNPRTETLSVNKTFTAIHNESGGGVPYQTIRVSGESGKAVPATGGEFVETKASGTITIYNSFSSESQRLIANTRFESKEGLIYRIKDAVTVPGQKISGGTTTPGSLEVTVYADEPGPEYNVSNTTFTIPGLEGDPRFTAFRAETNGAIVGGFSGTARQVDEEVLAQAREEIQEELKEQLVSEAEATTPNDFIFLSDAVTYTFEELPQTDSTDTTVKVNERLVLEGVIFNKRVLNDALLGVIFPDARGEASIVPLSSLQFTIPDEITEEFEFQISGEASIVWDIDVPELQQALAGTKRKNLTTTLSRFAAIERAEAILRPFWRRSFPAKADEITITIQ